MENDMRPVDGYEGEYLVSRNGLVYGIAHKHYLKPKINRYGYYVVNLCKDGKVKTHTVHRLVAKAFISNPLRKTTVNHINEIKTDNRVENLEWATMLEQNTHGTRIERAKMNTDYKTRNIDYSIVAAKHNYEELASRMQKPIAQITDDGNIVGIHKGINVAARKLGINSANIRKCLKGTIKHSGGYRWEYV